MKLHHRRGGNKGKPGGGGDDGGGTWDGTQDIVYVERSSKGKGEGRLIVVNSNGSKRAIAYSRSDGKFLGPSRPSLLAHENAIVFGGDDGVRPDVVALDRHGVQQGVLYTNRSGVLLVEHVPHLSGMVEARRGSSRALGFLGKHQESITLHLRR